MPEMVPVQQVIEVHQVVLRGQTRSAFSVRLVSGYDVIVVGTYWETDRFFEVADVLLVSYHDDLGTYSLASLEVVKGRSYYLLPGREPLEVEDLACSIYWHVVNAHGNP